MKKYLPLFFILLFPIALFSQDNLLDNWLTTVHLKLNYIDKIPELFSPDNPELIDVSIELRYNAKFKKLDYKILINDGDFNIYGVDNYTVDELDKILKRIWLNTQRVPIYLDGNKTKISQKDVSTITFIMDSKTSHVKSSEEMANYDKQVKSELTYSLQSSIVVISRTSITNGNNFKKE